MPDSMGTPSSCRAAEGGWRPTRGRRCASGRLRERGRSVRSRGRPDVRRGRGAGCRRGGTRWRSVPRMCRPPASMTFLVLGLGCGFVSGDSGVPGGLRGFELLAGVVEADHAGAGDGRDGSFGCGDGAGLLLADEVLAGHEVGVAAEENVGTAACHVGGDRDHAEAGRPGLRSRLLFRGTCVEDYVADAFALEDFAEELGFSMLVVRRGRAAFRRGGGRSRRLRRSIFSCAVR